MPPVTGRFLLQKCRVTLMLSELYRGIGKCIVTFSGDPPTIKVQQRQLIAGQKKEDFPMKITIGTDKKYIIVPDKFFAKIEELNAFRRENGVPEVKPMDYIRECFEKAMSNTDTNLKRQSDVVVKRNKSDKNESK